MNEPALRALLRHLALREAVASVSLSHPAECACRVCRAAQGDEDAFLAVLMGDDE